MTLISAIINKGYREAGILGINDTVTTAQSNEALDRLQSLYSSFFGNELGLPLEDVNYGENGLTNSYAVDTDDSQYIDSLYVPSNVRLISNLQTAKTVYLNPKPMDGTRFGVLDMSNNFGTFNLTVNGNGRLINSGTSQTLNTNGYTGEWFYRADLGNWTPITSLTAGSQSPLPQDFDDLLSTALALRLNPAYGAQTSQEMNLVLSRMRKNFRARYRQVVEEHAENALIRLPSNRFWRYSNSNTAFSRGKLV